MENEPKQMSTMFSGKIAENDEIDELTLFIRKLPTRPPRIDSPDPSNPDCTKMEADFSILLDG